MTCALCRHNDLEVVVQRDAKSTKRLLVYLCSICGLLQQHPIPTTNELREFYLRSYRVEYKKTYLPKPKHVYRAATAALHRLNWLHSAKITSGAILDIGAGGGEFVYMANQSGFDAQGIEPNAGYSEYARREYSVNILTCELAEVKAEKFEIVTLFHVLEHLPSPGSVFEQIHGILRDDGVVCIEVPWIEARDASPHNIYFKAHIFYFSVDTLTSFASRYFDLERVDTTSNLRAIFRRKKTPSALQLPDPSSVEAIKRRIREKGWWEYLVYGNGCLKPVKKLSQAMREHRVRQWSGQEIVDFILASGCIRGSTPIFIIALSFFPLCHWR